VYIVNTGNNTEAGGGLGGGFVQYATSRQPADWSSVSAVSTFDVFSASRSIIRLHNLRHPAAGPGLYLW